MKLHVAAHFLPMSNFMENVTVVKS